MARRMSPFQPIPKSISPRVARSMNVELIVSMFGLTSMQELLGLVEQPWSSVLMASPIAASASATICVPPSRKLTACP